MKFKEIKDKITLVVNKYDPENLIAIGAPADEYDDYILKIVSLYNNRQLNLSTLEELFGSKKSIDYRIFFNELEKILRQMTNE
jgi:predicted O-linked N-acetylglucosamine transferase (SPINDLY family)